MKLSEQQRLARAQHAQQRRADEAPQKRDATPGAFERVMRDAARRDTPPHDASARADASSCDGQASARTEEAELRGEQAQARAIEAQEVSVSVEDCAEIGRGLDDALRARDHHARDLDTRHHERLDEAEHLDAAQPAHLPEHLHDAQPARQRARDDADPARSGAATDALIAEARGVDTPHNAAPVDHAAPAAHTSDAYETIARLSRELVEACHVGQDQRQRKVVMLDIQLPGQGRIRARLRHSASGVEVRLRADTPALSALLKRHKGALHERARERGLHLSRVEIAERGEP